MNDNLDLAAIRARCDAATPGPWELCAPNLYPWVVTQADKEGEKTVTILGEGGYGILSFPSSLSSGKTEDYAFIAAARTDIPALLSEVERLTDDRDAWQKDFNALNDGGLKRIADITAERDALMQDFKIAMAKAGECYGCINLNESGKCNIFNCDCEVNDRWQWRGVPTAVRLTNKEDAE